MAQQQIITFDPDVAVPYGVNLTIFSGCTSSTSGVTGTDGTASATNTLILAW